VGLRSVPVLPWLFDCRNPANCAPRPEKNGAAVLGGVNCRLRITFPTSSDEEPSCKRKKNKKKNEEATFNCRDKQASIKSPEGIPDFEKF